MLDALAGPSGGLRELFRPLGSAKALGSLQAGLFARLVACLIVKRAVPLLAWLQVRPAVRCNLKLRFWMHQSEVR